MQYQLISCLFERFGFEHFCADTVQGYNADFHIQWFGLWRNTNERMFAHNSNNVVREERGFPEHAMLYSYSYVLVFKTEQAVRFHVKGLFDLYMLWVCTELL